MRYPCVPLLIAVAAFFGLAESPAFAAASPQGDYVVGSGFNPPGTWLVETIDVDARSGPSGESPSGVFSADFSTTSGSMRVDDAQVTCLQVSGNQATLVGRGTVWA
jgi:hypothetical protein